MVPERVLLAMANPVIHHRTPQFQAIMKETLARLKRVLHTENNVAILASSGTGAMEAAVANLASPGRKALTIESGKFGERWTELCGAFGFECEAVKVEWGKAIDPKVIAEKLAADPAIKAVFATHCETSTGVLHDVKALAAITGKTEAVLVVDAISAAPGNELRTDEWGVDMVVLGSQKALMMPPGLAMISASAKAKALIESAENVRAYYLNLKAALGKAAKNDTPYTPAVTLVIGLNESLKMIEEEGLEECLKRHATLAAAVRAGVQAIGLELFSERPSDTVTALKVPEGVDGVALVKDLRDVEGVTFAGGQAELKGRIVRIATMGYCTKYDVILGLGALELALKAAGHSMELGKAVAAAEEVFLA
jgi:aspartate aminotransferase-like enzyme